MTEQSDYVSCTQAMENSSIPFEEEGSEENAHEEVAVSNEHHGN